jgi:predicted nucleic acid-binding protein
LYNTILVPEQVGAELLVEDAPADELHTLTKFMAGCVVRRVPEVLPFSQGLSLADRAALTLAIDREADRLLADERLLRRISQVEGITTTGTIGVLFSAKSNQMISADEAKRDLKTLVSHHSFRISISIYEAAMEALALTQ